MNSGPRKKCTCNCIGWRVKYLRNNMGDSEIRSLPFPWITFAEFLEDLTESDFKRECALNADSIRQGTFRDFFTHALQNHICENSVIYMAVADMITNSGLTYGSEYLLNIKIIKSHLRLNNRASIFPENYGIQATAALAAGEYNFMQVLASYGYNGHISGDSYFARRLAVSALSFFLMGAYVPFPISLIPLGRYFLNKMLYSPIVDSYAATVGVRDTSDTKFSPLARFCFDPSWQPECISFKRLFVLILGMEILYYQLIDSSDGDRYIKTLEIYFRTITEPFLSVAELKSYWKDFVFEENKEQVLETWCRKFQDAVPFCIDKHEPRTLSHLCRCQIRKSLDGRDRTLPALVKDLNLPNDVKNFILCKSSKKTAFALYQNV